MSTEGKVAGIARRPARRAPMESVEAGRITVEAGLEGDHKGIRFPRRQISVLAAADWFAANRELGFEQPLCWTKRRSNLLLSGIRLPRAKGALISVGTVILEVTGQTVPCRRMEEVHSGLLKALYPQCRGGVTCRVIEGGDIAVDDRAEVLSSPPETDRRLPG